MSSYNKEAPASFRLSDFRYELPEELIAQAPLARRSDSRLMVLETNHITHRHVTDLPDCLRAGDHLVFNDTRVVPARLFGAKATGGSLEIMLERFNADGHALTKIRASKSPKAGSTIVLRASGSSSLPEGEFQARVIGRQHDLFELAGLPGQSSNLAEFFEQHGEIPLPPYIDRAPDAQDSERYQTVFAQKPGAVAAPTAGLHFDEELFARLTDRHITHSFVTLHVGAGTFQPMRVENPDEHVMHSERVSVGSATIDAIRTARRQGGRVIAVGTTCVRSLEAAAASGELDVFDGETQLFLRPGARF